MSHFDMTYTTGCRNKKVFAMNHLGALRTSYRVILGISRFVGTPRCRIFHWLAPGIPASGTRDQKWLAMCILETFETTYRVESQIQTNLMVWTWRQ